MSTPTPSSAGAGWVYPIPAQPVAPGGYRPVPGKPPHRRRTGLAVGLIAGGIGVLALVAAIAVALVVTFTQPQTLTTANGVVTVQVPGSWTDFSSTDAGQSYTSADEDDQWTVPDVEAEDLAGDASLTLWVSDSKDDPYTTVQQDLVATACDLDGCLSRGTATATTVAGRPAVQQLLRHPASKDVGSSTSLVVSLTRDSTVVSLILWWDEYADPDSAALLRSITLTR